MVTDEALGSFTFTEGANAINNGSVDLLVDQIQVMLVTELPDPDADTIAAFSALRVAGTTRPTLTGKSVTKEGRRSVFRAANPPSWTLAPGGDVVGAVLFEQRTPLFFIDTRIALEDGRLVGIPTNGSTFTLQFHADGVGYTQQ